MPAASLFRILRGSDSARSVQTLPCHASSKRKFVEVIVLNVYVYEHVHVQEFPLLNFVGCKKALKSRQNVSAATKRGIFFMRYEG